VRTTLDIDDDILAAARELAQRQQTTVGRVLSRLARATLTGGTPGEPTAAPGVAEPVAVGGFRPFASRGPTVTLADVDRIRDEEGV
jgi:hypothetical protein